MKHIAEFENFISDDFNTINEFLELCINDESNTYYPLVEELITVLDESEKRYRKLKQFIGSVKRREGKDVRKRLHALNKPQKEEEKSSPPSNNKPKSNLLKHVGVGAGAAAGGAAAVYGIKNLIAKRKAMKLKKQQEAEKKENI